MDSDFKSPRKWGHYLNWLRAKQDPIVQTLEKFHTAEEFTLSDPEPQTLDSFEASWPKWKRTSVQKFGTDWSKFSLGYRESAATTFLSLLFKG